MTTAKRTKLSKILGYMPSDEQFKAIEKLFTISIIQEIKDYPVDEMLGIQDTLFIRYLKMEVEDQ